MKRGGFLVCFVGIDGSGKSTQAQKLVGNFQSQGIEIGYVRNRLDPWLLAPVLKLGRLLFFRGEKKSRDYGRYLNTRRKLLGIFGAAQFFEYVALWEYLIQTIVKVRLPLAFKKDIVCDRYIYDLVVGLAADFDYPPERIKKVLRLCLRLLPKPNLVFLIDIPEEVAFQRKTDIPSPAFLTTRREIYRSLLEECGMVLLDGLGDANELETSILGKARDKLSLGKTLH
jgi:dTMP kinase